MRQASRERGSAATLVARLHERREEIEAATLTRVSAVSELPTVGGPEYAEGLRGAVAAGIAFAVEGIERGEEAAGPVPAALLAQARLAAALGVSLDTVLRRYVAGHTLLGDFLLEEAECLSLPPGELKALMRRLAAVVDRLLIAVSSAYDACSGEEARRRRGVERRRMELIERLLVGEPLDSRGLDYDVGVRHLGLVASGPGAADAVRALARSLGVGLLLAEREDGGLWAWIGCRRQLQSEAVHKHTTGSWPAEVSLAIGEAGDGLAGWRLTHRQAGAAFPVAQRRAERVVRYADVALLAAVLRDDLLATSLRRLYLEPLEGGRDGGVVLRETLRAYFAAGRNAASAAMALGVNRNTVASRLQAAEVRLARPLHTCAAEMETALSLLEVSDSTAGVTSAMHIAEASATNQAHRRYDPSSHLEAS